MARCRGTWPCCDKRVCGKSPGVVIGRSGLADLPPLHLLGGFRTDLPVSLQQRWQMKEGVEGGEGRGHGVEVRKVEGG
jgi:hypothetical protein